jgi:hypothetical protein
MVCRCRDSIIYRANDSDRLGFVGDRTSSTDYDDDMARGKSIGSNAFALNIGVDPYTNNDMKVFISFDFKW